MTLTKKQLKYLDPTTTVFKLIGNLANNPRLVNDPKAHFDRSLFVSRFHKILFSSIYNLVKDEGILDDISEADMVNYLSKFPAYEETFNNNDGVNYVHDAKETAKPETFWDDYNTIKKYAVLRQYVENGISIDDLIDLESDDIETINHGMKKIDSMTPEEVVDYFSTKVLRVKNEWRENNSSSSSFMGGDGVDEYLEKIQKEPDYGFPFIMNGYYNTILKGMRASKYIVNSAGTGTGKTRLTIQRSLGIAANEYYDTKQKKWVDNRPSMPVLVISSELDQEELTNLMLAFLTGIPSRDVSNGKFTSEQLERLKHASKVLKESPIYFEYMTEYNSADVSSVIEEYVITKDIKVCFFDYIMGNPKLQREFKESYGNGLREDQVLVNFSKRLKEIATDQDICIIAGSQTNASYLDTDINKSRTSNAVRGSRSIIDKADAALVLAKATPSDIEKLQKSGALEGHEEPNYGHFIYKNRADESELVIWSKLSLGNMREEPLFVTDYNYNLRSDIKPMNYKVKVID